MPSIWANFDHVFEVFQGLFFAFLIAKRCAGDEDALKSNPEWYEKIDSILGDTNTDLVNELVSFADYDSDKDLYDDSEDDDESNNANKEDKVENVSANKKKSIVEKPHKKRKAVRSQTQALRQLAGGMTKLIEIQVKRRKEQVEFEKERHRSFSELKKEEAEKNRRHELEIAKIFTSSINSSQQQRHFRYTPFDQTSLFQHSIQHAANFHNVTSPTSQLTSPPMSPPQHHHAITSFWKPHSSKYNLNIESTHFRSMFPFYSP